MCYVIVLCTPDHVNCMKHGCVMEAPCNDLWRGMIWRLVRVSIVLISNDQLLNIIDGVVLK